MNKDSINGLLVRVGADLSAGGGSWNGPVNEATGEFVYVAIPENSPVRAGMERPYSALAPNLEKFGVRLPAHLQMRHMHLDPDFEYLTYGDQGERARQLRKNLGIGDLIVFYAGLAATDKAARLVYALIGLLVVKEFILAADVPARDWNINAHSRRILVPGTKDLIVRGDPAVSGRLTRCVPIGEYRNRAYRVRKDVLEAWGGLSVKDGYIHRSARLPRLRNPALFVRWLENQGSSLKHTNN